MLFSILKTNISQTDFDNLLEVFAWFTADGSWEIPAWLQEWGVILGYLKEIECQ